MSLTTLPPKAASPLRTVLIGSSPKVSPPKPTLLPRLAAAASFVLAPPTKTDSASCAADLTSQTRTVQSDEPETSRDDSAEKDRLWIEDV